MTHDEIVKAMFDNFLEEIEDSEKYAQMGECAKKMGSDDLADGLFEMAYDEYTHAQFIHETITEQGITVPETIAKKWTELDEKMEAEFR